LGVACGFAALVDLSLAAGLVWDELLPAGLRSLVWVAVAVFWVGSAGYSYRAERRRAAPGPSDPSQDPFTEALDHYLKGNWFEAEHVLSGLLKRNPRDLDAGLMWATLLRHTRRLDEAAAELDRLARLEGSRRWALEIRRERQLLQEARQQREEEEAEAPGPGPTEEAGADAPSARIVEAA
jgi:hypothetical protein